LNTKIPTLIFVYTCSIMQLYLFREVRQFFTGVENLNGSEHFNCMKLFVLVNIEKVLGRYNNLLSDSVVGNNVEMLDYKF